MKTTFSFLAFSFLAGISTLRASVLYGPVTNAANGHLYYLLNATNWTAAQAEAVSLGGNLATINDQAEENWVYSTFSDYQSVPRLLWIGLNDAANPGTFVWADGGTSTYTNWGAGEPNNGGGIEFYTSIWASDGTQPGKWNDVPDSQPAYGVVEVIPPLAGIIRVSEVTVSWQSLPGVNYQVQFKNSVTDQTWQNVGPVQAGTGGTLNYADKVSGLGRVYQIQEVP